ncbi:hypothetical protein ASA1KI_06260 [Opitutales bacterium ASA1]|uniref:InlB B-repeat-containing protein n=1 Tax=Congregicoccus parvus TaxID=3081749 RepID=UPI002B2FE715|nr:hypothetical protein ASA1KI_06260 [Opitutales bacterium ASA1]
MNTRLHLALRHARSIACVFLASLFPTASPAQESTPPTFTIGSIPDQRVWYSASAEVRFAVAPGALGNGATLAATWSEGVAVAGARTFDPASALFRYVPAPTDAVPFTVTFSATAGGSSSSQTVTITPLRPLPSESSVFGLLPSGPLPDGESREFIDVAEKVVSGSVWFNAVQRPSLRDVVIVGKTIVFAPGHANELWNYNDNADLRSLSVHAETVIIRGVLRLPQTNVSIRATELIFEDVDGQPASSLTTTPLSSTIQPGKFSNGRSGHKAGTLELFVDAVTAPGSAKRFFLVGGNGERAGQGEAGSPGADRSIVKSIKNGIYEWTWTDNNTIYAYFDGLVNTSAGSSTWPGNGTPAKRGGIPGTAGDGGDFTSSIDVTALLQNNGGAQGTRAATQSGGRGGNPRPAYRRYFNSSRQTDIQTHWSSAGANAVGPDSAKPTGAVGTITVLPGDLRWLDPLALQKVLVHVRRAYLAQHFDFVRETLRDYVDLLALARESEGWADLSVDARTSLTQILDEMRTLLHRVDANLDYFGNPAGWVPMLSFEVNKLAFENEIPRALRIMYVNYWLGNAATSLQQKIDGMTRLRAELREEVDADRAAYATAIDAIPALEFKARSVQDAINLAKTDIETLKNELLPKAKNIALLKKTARALGAVAEIFPVGQPYVGLAGSTLTQLTYIDPDAPWTDNALIVGTNVAGRYSETGSYGKAEALKNAADSADPEAESQQVSIEQLQSLQAPLMDVLGESMNQIRNSQHPSPAVEAELQRLLADEPEYKTIVARLKVLNKQKTEFALELAQTMQTVARLSLAITRNLVTIDRLNRGIQANSLVLDPETTAWLAGMNERARDRLLKYHYFMARAFEYRMLQPYEGRLDLDAVFAKFQQLAVGTSTAELTPEKFGELRAVYEDQLSSVTFAILDQYNSNRPTLSAPVRLVLSQEILDAINDDGVASLNLADLGLFLPSQENVRIVDLKVIDLAAEYVGSRNDVFYADVVFQHSGISRLQKEGQLYSFAHYNEETRSKIEWSTRFDPFDESLDPVSPSAADQSLLKALLSTGSSTPSTDDLLLYSRPAADADLTITKDVASLRGADVRITSMRIELVYDFTRISDALRTLRIRTDADAVKPLVKVGTTDRNGRKDGEGDFLRTYNIGAVVPLSAPAAVGQFRFERWEGTGVADPTSPDTTVTMVAHTELKPIYRSVVPRAVNIVGGAPVGGPGGGSDPVTFTDGDQITVTATIPEGYRFVRWEGAGVASPSSPTTTVTVSGDTQISAVFELIRAFSAWLGNISARAQVGAGADILIPGFVIQGTQPKQVLVRAVGPALAGYGVEGTLVDPVLSVFDGANVLVASNDDWGSLAASPALATAFATTGAFELADGSKDAALVLELPPGAYTAQVSGAAGGIGVSLVEVYDVSGDTSDSRLVNISGRARVGIGGDILIPGFVVDGADTRRYLVRAVGPTLADFEVGDVLLDPKLTVFSGPNPVATNDDWNSGNDIAAIAAATAAVGAFELPPGSKDAVALLELPTGAYTIQVEGVGGTTGVALVEIYEVP